MSPLHTSEGIAKRVESIGETIFILVEYLGMDVAVLARNSKMRQGSSDEHQGSLAHGVPVSPF